MIVVLKRGRAFGFHTYAKVLLKEINSSRNRDQSKDDLKREPDLLQSHNDDEVPVESLEVNDSCLHWNHYKGLVRRPTTITVSYFLVEI